MPENIPAYQESRARAYQQYDAAFHLLKVTFPLVRDPKLLIGVVHNLFSAAEAGIDAILAYERELRLVPAYQDNFQSKFTIFQYKSARRNKTPAQVITMIWELKGILEAHRASPMEFQRGSRLVICGKNYRLTSLALNDLQDYLNHTKQFLEHMDSIIKFR